MTLQLDTSRRPHRPSEWVAIVEAVRAADPHDETDWIEWKRRLDLSNATGRFALAQGILGFANRDPPKAARHLEGHALFVVGVESGSLHGFQRIDPLDLEKQLLPFLGSDGPEYEVKQPQVDGKWVLMVSVMPPRNGDRIHTLRRNYAEHLPGRIFIRRGAETAEADPGEVAMLERRLVAGQLSTRVDGLVSVEWANGETPVLKGYEVTDDVLKPILEARRAQLDATPEPIPDERSGYIPMTGPLVGDVMTALKRYNAALPRYHAAVDDYMPKYETWLREWVVKRLAIFANPDLKVGLRNVSDRNVAEVQLKLHAPLKLRVYEDIPIDDLVGDEPPRPPAKPAVDRDGRFGFRGVQDIGMQLPSLGPYMEEFHVDADAAKTTITFPPVDLRPHELVELPALRVMPEGGAEGRFEVRWAATAKSHDGEAAGLLSLTASDVVVGPAPQKLIEILGLDRASSD